MSTRHLVQLALLLTIVFGAQARFLPYLPGDPAVTRAIQSLSPGTGWVAPFLTTASAPLKFGLMALAVLGAWRLAGIRAAVVVLAAIARRADPRRGLEVALRASAPGARFDRRDGQPHRSVVPVNLHDALQRHHRRAGRPGVAAQTRPRLATLVGDRGRRRYCWWSRRAPASSPAPIGRAMRSAPTPSVSVGWRWPSAPPAFLPGE